jgi:hypothetical protein
MVLLDCDSHHVPARLEKADLHTGASTQALALIVP